MALPLLSCRCDNWSINTASRRNKIIKIYPFEYLHSLRIQTVFSEAHRHSQNSESCIPGLTVS
jgi:hypothetical protein